MASGNVGGSTLTPDSGDLVAAGTLENAGYHTILLPGRPGITAGDPFCVMVRLQTPGSDYPLALEGVATGYSSSASAHAGQSYIADDESGAAGSWQDVGGTPDELNVCLKAFADEALVTTATGLEPDKSSGWVSGSRKVTLSARGGTGAVSTFYRLDGGSWRTTSGPSDCTATAVTSCSTIRATPPVRPRRSARVT